MNQAQQRVIWASALVAGLLGAATLKEVSKPGLNCRDALYGFVDRRGRWVSVKSRTCDHPER